MLSQQRLSANFRRERSGFRTGFDFDMATPISWSFVSQPVAPLFFPKLGASSERKWTWLTLQQACVVTRPAETPSLVNPFPFQVATLLQRVLRSRVFQISITSFPNPRRCLPHEERPAVNFFAPRNDQVDTGHCDIAT